MDAIRWSCHDDVKKQPFLLEQEKRSWLLNRLLAYWSSACGHQHRFLCEPSAASQEQICVWGQLKVSINEMAGSDCRVSLRDSAEIHRNVAATDWVAMEADYSSITRKGKGQSVWQHRSTAGRNKLTRYSYIIIQREGTKHEQWHANGFHYTNVLKTINLHHFHKVTIGGMKHCV